MSPMFTRKRPFKKRIRPTTEQELQGCMRRRSMPTESYTAIASWAKAQFCLIDAPSLQVIGRVLKSESSLRQLTHECLARKKRRPLHQLCLDQCVVQFLTFCEEFQLALSGSMIVGYALRHELSPETIEHCWRHTGLLTKADISFILN
ncbi:hypothetical protein GN958_ATG23481 [Phytophthora infestans]|uniref:Uncharacterized protein n=1 Tax=Phytophthora infestans TaxID=4787 RepID=A0A8S9TMW6_PHYIN|nr:hypothetical protein GN958_ATG23481 [Phytophthora infestans]